jgi:hypothetical protein
VADLGALVRLSCRLRERLRERPPAQLPPPQDQEVRGLLRASLPELRALLEIMTKTTEAPS